jgi:hypothetical protein
MRTPRALVEREDPAAPHHQCCVLAISRFQSIAGWPRSARRDLWTWTIDFADRLCFSRFPSQLRKAGKCWSSRADRHWANREIRGLHLRDGWAASQLGSAPLFRPHTRGTTTGKGLDIDQIKGRSPPTIAIIEIECIA